MKRKDLMTLRVKDIMAELNDYYRTGNELLPEIYTGIFVRSHITYFIQETQVKRVERCGLGIENSLVGTFKFRSAADMELLDKTIYHDYKRISKARRTMQD